MKRTLFSLWLILLTAAVASAGLTGGSYKQHAGTVLSDSMVWKASGTIPGANVRVDTLIGSTPNDTSYAYEVAGAQFVAIQANAWGRNADIDFTLQPQISADNGTTWFNLATTFSEAQTTSVAEVLSGGVTAELWCVLKYPVEGDTLLTSNSATRGKYIVTHSDNMLMGAARWLRLKVDTDGGAATDTVRLTTIITRVY